MDKEARMARIKEGREERGKFGHRYKDPKLGKSNKEKERKKSFMMLRHKINKKHKRSFKDKQVSFLFYLNFLIKFYGNFFFLKKKVALRTSLLKQKRLK